MYIYYYRFYNSMASVLRTSNIIFLIFFLIHLVNFVEGLNISKLKQIEDPITTQNAVVGAVITKYDLVQFMNPIGKGYGLYCDLKDKSTTGEKMEFKLVSTEGSGGTSHQIITDKLFIREGDKFRLQCSDSSPGMIHLNSKFGTSKDETEWICKKDLSPNQRGNDEQFFTFKFVNGRGKLRYYDTVQLIHAASGKYITVNPEGSAQLKEVIAGEESYNKYTRFVLMRRYNERVADNYYFTKAYAGKLVKSQDMVNLINVASLHRLEMDGSGNFKKVGDHYLSYILASGYPTTNPTRILSSYTHLHAGAYLKFTANGVVMIANPDLNAFGVKENKLVCRAVESYLKKEYSDWQVETVWGQDYKKGWTRSGDVIRLKNRELGCYLSSAPASGFENQLISRFSQEINCKPGAPDASTLWTIALSFRDLNKYEDCEENLGVAPGFTPLDGPTRNPYDDVDTGEEDEPNDIYNNNSSGGGSAPTEDEVCLI